MTQTLRERVQLMVLSRLRGASDRLQHGKVSSRRLARATTEPPVFCKASAPARSHRRLIHQRRRGNTGRSSHQLPHLPNNCSSPSCWVRRGACHRRPSNRRRAHRLAARGVLFLDEVSEMSLTAQVEGLAFRPGTRVSAPGGRESKGGRCIIRRREPDPATR